MTENDSDYVRDGRAIYEQSFAIIRREARLDALPADLQPVAVRMMHACGQTDLVQDLRYSTNCVAHARAALHAGAPILCDSEMVAHGVTRARLPADNEVICTLRDERTPAIAERIGNTRSAAGLELWRQHLAGALVVIGNAPTALFHFLEMMAANTPQPAAILGLPVGFVGAAESKDALAGQTLELEFLTLRGRRGGSAMAAAAVNALAREAI